MSTPSTTADDLFGDFLSMPEPDAAPAVVLSDKLDSDPFGDWLNEPGPADTAGINFDIPIGGVPPVAGPEPAPEDMPTDEELKELMPDIQPLPDNADVRSAQLYENAMFVDISFSQFGNETKLSVDLLDIKDPTDLGGDDDDDDDEQEQDPLNIFSNLSAPAADTKNKKPDKKMISAKKKLLTSPELKEISKKKNEIMAYVQAKSLPSFLRKAVYTIAKTEVGEFHAQMLLYKEQWDALVETACSMYPQRLEEAKAQLGSLWNSRDYKSPARFRSSFGFEWQFVEYGVPKSLESIEPEIYNAAMEKMRDKMKSSLGKMQQALRLGMAQLVIGLREKLLPSPDGQKKRIFESSVANLKDFLDAFDAKNTLVNDAQLQKLVEQARSIVAGDSKTIIENIRNGDDYRAAMATQFEGMTAALDQMIGEKPARKIRMDLKRKAEAAEAAAE